MSGLDSFQVFSMWATSNSVSRHVSRSGRLGAPAAIGGLDRQKTIKDKIKNELVKFYLNYDTRCCTILYIVKVAVHHHELSKNYERVTI